MPVTLDGPIHLQQSADISGDAVIGVVAAQGGVYFVDLVLIVSCRIRRISSCKDIRPRRKRDFSVRIPTLKLPFRFRVQYSVNPRK